MNVIGKDYEKVDVEKVWRISQRNAQLRFAFNNAPNYFARLKVIAAFWKEYEQEIIEYGRKSLNAWYTSYPIDWSTVQTPIEQEAWIRIRSKGGIVLYPQYPVLNYHVDFGNPSLRIALEVDGKEFHNQKKDFLRDQELFNAGWRIYRISGSEMMRWKFNAIDDFEDDPFVHYDELKYWLTETGDGVIEAIKAIHFNKNIDKLDYRFRGLCEMSLMEHCNQPF